jgi:hypothetical protein
MPKNIFLAVAKTRKPHTKISYLHLDNERSYRHRE